MDNLAKDLLMTAHYNCITMVMETLQVRMSKGLVEKLDRFVETGMYANRSDVIRSAVRQINWAAEVGTIPNRGSAVKQIRKARDALSKQKIDLNELNKL